MTRERAKELAPIIAAYGEGKTIESRSESGTWYDLPCPSFDGTVDYRIKPEPITRPMTRGEVLYMATTTPGMVTHTPDGIIGPASGCSYASPIEGYEYAIIDKHGNPVDGWKRFEVAE